MPTLEQAAKAWTALGQVFRPSWYEVEASFAGRTHVSSAQIRTTDRTAQQIADEEDR